MIENFLSAVEENNARLCLTLFKKEQSPQKKNRMANSLTKTGLHPIHWACFNDNHELLKMLHHYGGEITVKTKQDIKHNNNFIPRGFSPLHACATFNSPGCVRQLIK